MKNTLVVVLFCLSLLGCKQKVESVDIPKINGYWEIEKVTFDDRDDKEYRVNQNYDYFKIDSKNKGIRKKVSPQLDGTFLVDNTYQTINIRFKGDKTYLDYSTPYAKWTEEIIYLSSDELVILNQQNNEYHYKKVAPISK